MSMRTMSVTLERLPASRAAQQTSNASLLRIRGTCVDQAGCSLAMDLSSLLLAWMQRTGGVPNACGVTC
jgi:hypothetical protein